MPYSSCSLFQFSFGSRSSFWVWWWDIFRIDFFSYQGVVLYWNCVFMLLLLVILFWEVHMLLHSRFLRILYRFLGDSMDLRRVLRLSILNILFRYIKSSCRQTMTKHINCFLSLLSKATILAPLFFMLSTSWAGFVWKHFFIISRTR